MLDIFRLDKKQYLNLLGSMWLAAVVFCTSNLANGFLVHVMGKHTYGSYHLILQIATAAAQFFVFGVDDLIMRDLPSLLENHRVDAIHAFIKWCVISIIKSIIVIALVLILFLLVHWLVLKLNYCSSTLCRNTMNLTYLVISLTPLLIVMDCFAAFLTCIKYIFVSQLISRSGLYLLVFFVFLMGHGKGKMTILLVMMALLASYALICFLKVVIACRFFIKSKELSISSIFRSSTNKQVSWQLRKSGLIFVGNTAAYTVLGLINVLFMLFLGKGVVSIAHYAIISLIVGFSTIFSGSFSVIISRCYSNLSETYRLQRLQRVINFNLIIGFIWMLLSLVLAFFVSHFILKFYSIDSKYAAPSIVVSIIFNYIISVIIQSEEVCYYNNLNKKLYFVTGSQIVLQSFACFFLIPVFSYFGAILASLISEIYAGLLCWRVLKKHKIPIKIFGII